MSGLEYTANLPTRKPSEYQEKARSIIFAVLSLGLIMLIFGVVDAIIVIYRGWTYTPDVVFGFITLGVFLSFFCAFMILWGRFGWKLESAFDPMTKALALYQEQRAHAPTGYTPSTAPPTPYKSSIELQELPSRSYSLPAPSHYEQPSYTPYEGGFK
jgi:hypothetical protein